jgi:hypothetical protein
MDVGGIPGYDEIGECHSLKRATGDDAVGAVDACRAREAEDSRVVERRHQRLRYAALARLAGGAVDRPSNAWKILKSTSTPLFALLTLSVLFPHPYPSLSHQLRARHDHLHFHSYPSPALSFIRHVVSQVHFAPLELRSSASCKLDEADHVYSGIFGYINYLVEKDRNYILNTLINGK